MPFFDEIQIGWGRVPRSIRVPRGAHTLRSPELTFEQNVEFLIRQGLETPIGSLPLSKQLEKARTVCVLAPDETRKDVFSVLWPEIKGFLINHDLTLGIAAGKHDVKDAPDGFWRHDALRQDLRHMGFTSRGTPVSFPDDVLNADLRILLGEIRPHYFAGYAGGAKTLFPGVAGAVGIWENHKMKALPNARLGRVDDNPCRLDMEEAAVMAGPSILINVIRAPNGKIVDVVTGDIVQAHREGVRRARRLFEIPVSKRAEVVVVSDSNPVSMNLYQACKLLVPAGAILKDGGTVILAAECGEGIGPVDVINRDIYRLGSIHSLPKEHRVILVSSRTPEEVEPTFAEFAHSVDELLLNVAPEEIVIIPNAGDIVPRVS